MKKALVLLGMVGFAGWLALEISIRMVVLPEALFEAPPSTPVIEDVRGRILHIQALDASRDARPVPVHAMGRWLPLMTVAIEDRRFASHRGIDPVGLAGAAWRNVRNARVISGGSTISQQTIKIASGQRSRTFSTKVHEALAAMRLEREWTKEQILFHYMNRLDYGNRRIGPMAAANAYFGKDPADLTLGEAIYLAGLPQGPTRLNPWKHPARALARYKDNVRRIAHLLPEGIEALLAAPPVPIRRDPVSCALHFVQKAKSRHPASRLGSRTTLDMKLQTLAENTTSSYATRLQELGATGCAVVILDNASGGVRAMVSSSSPRYSEINLTTMPRSAGSTLKPFLYAEAIDRRTLTAASLLPDTAESIGGIYTDYDPRNFNHRFLGPVRLREALANSLNVPAVIALSDIGARGAFVKLLSWGLGFRHGFDAYGAGFILGNAEVSLLDLAGAYAALARSGVAWDPVFFPGEPAQPRRVVSPAAAAIITDILCDNDARRSSFGNASPLDVGCRVAVKTGTSSAFRDGWCLGFTSEHTIGVWAGNPDGSPMNSALAVNSAAPIWNALVHALLSSGDTPLPELQESEAIESHRVCRQTGLLPRDGEPTVREWFLTGTAPVRNSNEMYRGKTLVLPPVYASWCASAQNRLGAVTENGPLEITFPRDGAVFAINPHLPMTQQTLRPLSTNPHCEWLLNGEKLPAAGAMLQRGDHRLTARLGSEVRTASFRVE